jgi:hypothetical protein
LKDTPAWAFNGENDQSVPYQNQTATVGSINVCNPPEPAKVTVLPGADHDTAEPEVLTLSGLGQGLAPYDIYDQSIYDWLLEHSRAPTSRLVSGAALPNDTPTPMSELSLTVAAAIRMGQSTTLRWTFKGAGSCIASGDWQGPRPASGAESVMPVAPGAYGYILSCAGPGGAVARSVWLEVREAARVPPL